MSLVVLPFDVASIVYRMISGRDVARIAATNRAMRHSVRQCSVNLHEGVCSEITRIGQWLPLPRECSLMARDITMQNCDQILDEIAGIFFRVLTLNDLSSESLVQLSAVRTYFLQKRLADALSASAAVRKPQWHATLEFFKPMIDGCRLSEVNAVFDLYAPRELRTRSLVVGEISYKFSLRQEFARALCAAHMIPAAWIGQRYHVLCKIVDQLIAIKRFALAEWVIGNQLGEGELPNKQYVKLAIALGFDGQLNEALRVALLLKPHEGRDEFSLSIYVEIAAHFVRKNQLAEAISFIDSTPLISRDKLITRGMCFVLIDQYNLSDAKRFAAEIIDCNLRNEVQFQICKAHIDSGELREAESYAFECLTPRLCDDILFKILWLRRREELSGQPPQKKQR